MKSDFAQVRRWIGRGDGQHRLGLVATKPRLLMTASVLLGVIVCFVSWCGIDYWRSGYRPPRTDDIVGMSAQFRERDTGIEFGPFDVDESSWNAICESLSPWEHDWSPAKWEYMGTLTVRIRNGRTLHVCLFDLPSEPVGAFSLGPNELDRGYFRGGNSNRLRKVLKDAYSRTQAKNDSTNGPSEPPRR
jgi:hypothetical protein